MYVHYQKRWDYVKRLFHVTTLTLEQKDAKNSFMVDVVGTGTTLKLFHNAMESVHQKVLNFMENIFTKLPYVASKDGGMIAKVLVTSSLWIS
jgi:adenosyl cobinamide kinase/adenosyl cobinamide phosphate guanylyltransferase